MEEQELERWEARREREKDRVRVKLGHIVGLIERVAQERDALARDRAKERLVDAFADLMFEGPGPDPER